MIENKEAHPFQQDPQIVFDTNHPVFDYFKKISQIPRLSGHENRMSQSLVAWCRALGYLVRQDAYGNVLVDYPGRPAEQAVSVILQAHMDMVPAKAKDVEHDFSADPLRLKETNGWLEAEGTSLGADSGMGMALALAYLASYPKGPRLRVLFTKGEGLSMAGAQALAAADLQGRFLINLDGEEEGVAIDASAGYEILHYGLPMDWTPLDEAWAFLSVSLTGLKGGHSGADILDVHSHAIKSLAQWIRLVGEQTPIRLVAIDGGARNNFIPQEARAILAYPRDQEGVLLEEMAAVRDQLLSVLLRSDPDANFTWDATEKRARAMSPVLGQKVLSLIESMPHGVQHLFENQEEVAASINLARVQTSAEAVCFWVSYRSYTYSALHQMREQVGELVQVFGVEAEQVGGFPIWARSERSFLRKTYRRLYQELSGKEALVKRVHYGLECGVFAQKNPNLDLLSIGPTVEEGQSPDERVDLGSCLRTFSLLHHLVEEISKGPTELERERV